MRCWSQFNFAIGGVWTPSSPQWSPHSTKLQSTDHAGEGEEQEEECDDVDEYFQGWLYYKTMVIMVLIVMLLIPMVMMMIKTMLGWSYV